MKSTEYEIKKLETVGADGKILPEIYEACMIVKKAFQSQLDELEK